MRRKTLLEDPPPVQRQMHATEATISMKREDTARRASNESSTAVVCYSSLTTHHFIGVRGAIEK